jgi:hypothetical protein
MDSKTSTTMSIEDLWDYLHTSIVYGNLPMLKSLLENSVVSNLTLKTMDQLFFNLLTTSLDERKEKNFILSFLRLWNEYRLKGEENDKIRLKGSNFAQNIMKEEMMGHLDTDQDYQKMKMENYGNRELDPDEELQIKSNFYLKQKCSDDYNFGRIILHPEMNDNMLHDLVVHLNISYIISVKAVYLNRYDNDISDGLIKISRIYGAQPFATYTELMSYFFTKMSKKETKELIRKILEEEDEVEYNIFNKTMSEFLISEIQKYSDYSAVPPWILKEKVTQKRIEEYVNAMNDSEYVYIPLPEPKEAAKLIIKSFDKNWLKHMKKRITKEGLKVLTIENMEEVTTEAYENATSDIFRFSMMPDDVLEKVFFSKDNDLQAKRILGLSNPFTFSPAEGENSRMYFNLTYLKKDKSGRRDVHWFTGNCDYCNRKIRHYWYAVRKPVINGGWEGCFCSWKHVRKSLPIIPNEFLERFAPSTIVERMILYFENEIAKVGVYERDEVIEEEDTYGQLTEEMLEDMFWKNEDEEVTHKRRRIED